MTYTTPPAKCPGCGGNRQPANSTCARCARRNIRAEREAFAAQEAARAAAEAEAAHRRALARLGPYRCRAHHDQPVTWRGKGCTACRQEVAA